MNRPKYFVSSAKTGMPSVSRSTEIRPGMFKSSGITNPTLVGPSSSSAKKDNSENQQRPRSGSGFTQKKQAKSQSRVYSDLSIVTDISNDQKASGEDKKTSEDSMLCDVDEDICKELVTKDATREIPRSPNNIQKLQIAQSYRNYLSTQGISNTTATSSFLNSPASSKLPPHSASIALKEQLKPGLATTTNRSAQKTQRLGVSCDFNGYIKNFDSYTDEIKRFQNHILDKELSIAERMKYIFYLRVVHSKINKNIHNFQSELIPLELFIIKEYIDDEFRREQLSNGGYTSNYRQDRDIVSRSLLFIFENLNSTETFTNALLKAEICRTFGDMSYNTAKYFLEQLLKNGVESFNLKYEARTSLRKIEFPPVAHKVSVPHSTLHIKRVVTDAVYKRPNSNSVIHPESAKIPKDHSLSRRAKLKFSFRQNENEVESFTLSSPRGDTSPKKIDQTTLKALQSKSVKGSSKENARVKGEANVRVNDECDIEPENVEQEENIKQVANTMEKKLQSRFEAIKIDSDTDKQPCQATRYNAKKRFELTISNEDSVADNMKQTVRMTPHRVQMKDYFTQN